MQTNIEVVRLALDHIAAHLPEKLTFTSVAEVFHYSPYFFDRIFQRITGSTITEHIRAQRLLRAAQLLSGPASVTDICMSCGFESSQSFSRAFRRQFGLSPRAYRQAGLKPAMPQPDAIIRAYLDRLKGGQHAMVPKIIHLNEMLIAGISGDGNRTGEVWDTYMERERTAPLHNRMGEEAFEVRSYQADRCTVFVGIQVERPDDTGRYGLYRLPAGVYASFEILLANGWEHNNRLMDRWLKENGQTYAQRREDGTGAYYSIQVYGDRFLGMDNLDSVIEMWIPLVPEFPLPTLP